MKKLVRLYFYVVAFIHLQRKRLLRFHEIIRLYNELDVKSKAFVDALTSRKREFDEEFQERCKGDNKITELKSVIAERDKEIAELKRQLEAARFKKTDNKVKQPGWGQ